jgi:Sec-independent protein secretion pathway component TatC
MIVPLILLYELSIFLSALIHRRRKEQLEEVLEPSAEPPAESVEAG